jgi:hypothetical protein
MAGVLRVITHEEIDHEIQVMAGVCAGCLP